MTIESPRSRHSFLLACTAAFAFLWVLARACVQSLTIDESDTFLAFVLRPVASHWYGGANNHVLNSALMRLFTMVFGRSELTLRLPALIGTAVYIVSVYFLVRFITDRKLLQWAIFVCLVYNPFVMDYLVAARGYSLAMGFLTCAIALAAAYRAGVSTAPAPESLYKAASLISACLALSFAANFSFAIADTIVLVLIAIWIGREPLAGKAKLAAAFVLPGLATAYFLVAAAVLSWPKGQFTWGAHSLLETGRSMLQAALFEPSAYLLNPRLRHYFVHFGTWLYPLLGVFLIYRGVMLYLERRKSPVAPLALLGAAALVLTLAGHQILYSLYGVLLPLDRTGLFLALLIFLTAGAAAAVPGASRAGRIAATGLTAVLVLIACYSISCLRLTYFKEWQYDADMKKVYSVLAYYNRTYGLKDVKVNWRYVATLNTYRVLSGRETLNEISPAPPVVNDYPKGFQAYVIFGPWDWGFAQREGLKTVYREDFSGVMVSIRPELESARPCPQ